MLAVEKITEVLPFARLIRGEVVNDDITVGYSPAMGPVPAKLTIGAMWSRRHFRFREFDFYDVTETTVDPHGRTFKLTRTPAKANRDRFGNGHYCVRIEGPLSSCDCPGWHGKERVGQPCKHAVAMAFVVGRERDRELCALQEGETASTQTVLGLPTESGDSPVVPVNEQIREADFGQLSTAG